MALISMATYSDGRNDDYVVITTDVGRIAITQAEKGNVSDPDPTTMENAIKTEMIKRTAAGGKSEVTDNLFVHVNRAGGRVGEIALAWGALPDMWPEDEPKE